MRVKHQQDERAVFPQLRPEDFLTTGMPFQAVWSPSQSATVRPASAILSLLCDFREPSPISSALVSAGPLGLTLFHFPGIVEFSVSEFLLSHTITPV